MAFNEFKIQDEGDFSDKVPSLKEIALLHIKKISDICCNEFTKGRWEEKPVKVGGGITITRKYIQDQRAIFCNAVDFLLWLVYPYADEKFRNTYKLEETTEEEKKEWEAKIEERRKIFINIMLMFHRTNYFDSQTGQTE